MDADYRIPCFQSLLQIVRILPENQVVVLNVKVQPVFPLSICTRLFEPVFPERFDDNIAQPFGLVCFVVHSKIVSVPPYQTRTQ
jgi:hypothetical protein